MSHPNFFACIEHALSARPAQVCLVWPAAAKQPAQTHTGADVLRQVRRAQRQLLTQGVQPAELVLVLVPVGPALVAALLALMALGAVPVLPPAKVSGLGLYQLLRRHHIKRAVMPPAARRWRVLGRLLGLKLLAVDTTAGASADAEPLPVAAVAPDLPALVSHSSGSTGQPKAIRRVHAVLGAQHAALRAAFPPWPGQRDFPLFPNVILHNLAVGAVSIVPAVPPGGLARLHPARIVAQLRAERVETLTGNVFYFEALCSHWQRHPTDLRGVRALGVGGSPVPETLLRALRAVFPQAGIFVVYGSSEAEPIAVREVTAATVAPDPRLGYAVGRPRPELECRLRPTATLRLPDGRRAEAGEVLVRGAHVAAAPGAWLATGDFGYFDAAGQLVLTARQGNDTAHAGTHHYQLEHWLRHLPGVAQAAARATPRGFAVYVQGPVQPAAVRHALHDAFPDVPITGVHLRRQLPVDARHRSKILYDRLA